MEKLNEVKTIGQNDKLERKKFNKVWFLTIFGFINARFNPNTLRFEKSAMLRLNACFIALIKASFCFKFTLSNQFEREDPIQLWVGCVFNYLDPLPKFYISVIGVIGVVWILMVHFVFKLNARKDYFLFRKWMILMNEWPIESGANNEVVGLSTETNEKFWLTENHVNRVWFRTVNMCLAVGCVVFCSQQFFISFPNVPMTLYILLQTFHIITNSIAVVGYLHSIYTVNLFYLEMMKFLAKKFAYLSAQCELLGRPKSDKISDRKLGRLIDQYTTVESEVLYQNNFFKAFLGTNVICYFGAAVLVTFVAILVDLRMRITVMCVIIMMYFTVLLIPFWVASNVRKEMNRARLVFERASFGRSISLRNKQRINLICFLNKRAGFTCLDLFAIDAYSGITLSLQIVVNFLLLVKVYLFRPNLYTSPFV